MKDNIYNKIQNQIVEKMKEISKLYEEVYFLTRERDELSRELRKR
jgi:hypothetical protein